MKKKIISIVLAVIIGVAGGLGTSAVIREKQLKSALASSCFFALRGLSQNLGSIETTGECPGQVSEEMQRNITSLGTAISVANRFTQGHKQISGGVYDLARALGTWTVSINNTEVAGILWDGEISAQELEFIGLLKADIDALLAPFYAEDGLNLRSGGIKWSELREPLGQFMQKWVTWNPAFGEHWRGLNLK